MEREPREDPRDDWEHADVASSTDAYARRFDGSVGAWFLEVQARHTLDLVGRSDPLRVLDVGGGHGQLTGPLLEAGHNVTVLGSDPRCGQRIQRWVREGRCRFDVGNLVDLPYPERSFDAALAFRLLPHVEDWRRLLAELCRVARSVVVVDYPSVRSANVIAEPLFSLKSRLETDTRPFRRFSPRQVEDALAAEGFAVRAHRGQFLLPMVLHRALKSGRLSNGMEAAARWSGATRYLGSPVIIRADRV